MALSLLLRLQLVYALAGIGFNIVSYIIMQTGGQQLTATNPVTGFFAMSAYGLCLLAGHGGHIGLYRLLMGVAVPVFLFGGVLVHLDNYANDPSLYASFGAFLGGMMINVYGLPLNVLAAAGWFRRGSG